MSIQTDLTRIKNAKAAIKAAIAGKGVTVPDGTMLDGMASLIGEIQAGGGSVASVPKKDVNFYDYDGTRLYSYTVSEAQALTELPALPTQPGLVCQGWNWSLEDIKSMKRAVNVGSVYITDDGKTRLYITIAAEGRMAVPLHISQTVENGVAIDWGDGSAAETLSGTGNVNTTHTYESIGDYVITLDVANGCALGLGTKSTSAIVVGSNTAHKNMLKKVEIGNNLTIIDTYAFSSCYSLSSVTIPNSVTSIGSGVFSSCYSLTSVTIPYGITGIYTNTFLKCYSLASVIIPNSVTSIGSGVFNSCYSLTSITIPNGVTSISRDVFYYCYSLTSITIPNGVTSISASMFDYCFSLGSITIPNSVTSIGGSSFRNCNSLASVTIPNSVTSIDSYAFYNCSSLASVTIPNSVTSISDSTFRNCTGMAFYDFTGHTAVPKLYNTSAFNSIPSDCQIRVPAALYDEWIKETNWSTYASQIVAA